MGKAALLIAFGASLFIAQGMVSQNETERHTTHAQADFEEGVVAREIARTGFNVAMGILRSHGNDLHGAIKAINKHGAKKYLEGQHQGGTFRVRAELKDGNVVQVISAGYIGGTFKTLNGNQKPEPGWCREPDPVTGELYTGACHSMWDASSPLYEYELPSGDPLVAKMECGKLETTFIESQAGYCSAIFLERRLPDPTNEDDPNAGDPEPPEMLFLPGRNRDGQTLSVSKYVTGGTQMNFFIGVDQNCSLRPTAPVPVEEFPAFTGSESNPAPYDHLHYALMEDVGEFGNMAETPWAFTEMHPDGISQNGSGQEVQRWRIGWEDQHITAWDNPGSSNPANSLQALKRLGYDGNGWPLADDLGYRDLRDYGSRPDFSDQVIEVKLLEETDLSRCEPPSDPDPDPTPDPDPDAEPDPEPTPDCACPEKNKNNKKVAVWHKLPNQKKGKTICIAEPAVQAHLNNHDDHVVCRGD